MRGRVIRVILHPEDINKSEDDSALLGANGKRARFVSLFERLKRLGLIKGVREQGYKSNNSGPGKQLCPNSAPVPIVLPSYDTKLLQELTFHPARSTNMVALELQFASYPA
ncbi:uncharacterized protein DFL_000044 [Arthrobotrys flagrans]|uniref:Uncharacterized protein n=1 Tax=Arthrobotrys flagrans TaxID=97331 RepID=A0A437ADY6_ARTFL|nr:hypothetical protein DFL_000044 [Arthrobotrys flagrans]